MIVLLRDACCFRGADFVRWVVVRGGCEEFEGSWGSGFCNGWVRHVVMA